MISELQFIRNYSSFWNSLFPGGDDYIRIINSSLGKRLNDNITIKDNPNRRALVNGVAFNIFTKIINKQFSRSILNNIYNENPIILEVINEETKFLSNLRYGSELKNILIDKEDAIIKTICERLLKVYGRKSLLINPKIKGCGIIYECKPDIIYGSVLGEIKAGNRNFGIKDIRQLYVYLALNQQSKEFELNQIEMYNPRTGIYWKEYINVVSINISGSSTTEICNEILDFISNYNRSI